MRTYNLACRRARGREDCAREHFRQVRSRPIYAVRKEREFIFPGEDKSARAGKSISWPAARPAGDRTSRYAFYNIFPSQFPFAHRRRESKVPRGSGESERETRSRGRGRNSNPFAHDKRERWLVSYIVQRDQVLLYVSYFVLEIYIDNSLWEITGTSLVILK